MPSDRSQECNKNFSLVFVSIISLYSYLFSDRWPFHNTLIHELSHCRHCRISSVRSGRPAASGRLVARKPQKWLVVKPEESLCGFSCSEWSSTAHESWRERIRRLRYVPNSASHRKRLDMWENNLYLAHMGPRALLRGTSCPYAYTRAALKINMSLSLAIHRPVL